MRPLWCGLLCLFLLGCTGNGGWPANRLDCMIGLENDGLGPCAPGTPGYDRQANAQAQAQANATAIASNDDAQCRSYGAEPGSPSYIQCRMNLDNQRAANKRAAISAILANRPTPQPYYLPQPPQSRTTTCTYGGSTVGGNTNGSMTCY
jgi:hypothetical protein